MTKDDMMQMEYDARMKIIEDYVQKIVKIRKENGERIIEGVIPIASKKQLAEVMGMSVGEVVDIIELDERQKEYDARLKGIRDYNQGIYEAWERGFEKGWKEVIRNRALALKNYLPISQIAEKMKISVEELEEILEK